MILYLNVVIVSFMAESIAVGCVGNYVSAREVGHYHSLSRQGNVQRLGQALGGVQRAEKVSERGVNQNWTIFGIKCSDTLPTIIRKV